VSDLTPEAEADEIMEAWAACDCARCRAEHTYECLRDRIAAALAARTD
jgi:hypothetical protein